MKITNIEMKKTAKQADYKQVTTDIPDGKYNMRFNVFQFHSLYKLLEVGTELNNETVNKEGEYWNLFDPEAKTHKYRGGDKSTAKLEGDTLAIIVANQNTIQSDLRKIKKALKAILKEMGIEYEENSQ